MAPEASTTTRPGKRSVLLVELLDGAGSDAADVSEHCAVLRAAGARVRAALLTQDDGHATARKSEPAGRAGTVPIERFGAGRTEVDALLTLAANGHFELALVAASGSGGTRIARALSPIVATLGWPTGFAAASGWLTRLGWGVVDASAELPGDEAEPRAPAGIAWSSVEGSRLGRGRPTLWDGEYVLAPHALAGEVGAELIAGFAEVARQRPSLDLVILGERQPLIEREARTQGIGGRVHCVGAAPRDAEWTWWAHAAAAMLGGRGPISGGLILRGLAAGCPMLVAAVGPTAPVAAWLSRAGCAPSQQMERGAVALALSEVLERGPAVELALQRGRVLAAAHEPARLAPRLATALAKMLPTPIEPTRADAA